MTVKKALLRSKCVVLGGATVGKTALVQMFNSDGNQYPKTYNMTIQTDVCVKPVNIPDSDVSVELYIYDIGGHDVYHEYVNRYVKGAITYLLVFDVTDLDSFKATSKWMQIVKQIKELKTRTGALVATKIDQKNRRVVSTKQGEELAKQFNLMYFETSSAEGVDVEAPFYYVASAFYDAFQESAKHFVKAATEAQ